VNDQQRYLQEKLNEWRTAARTAIGGPYAGKLPGEQKPMQVQRAEIAIKNLQRIVAAWEKKARARHDNAMKKIEAAYRAAREQVLFAKPADALKFIKKLKPNDRV
jgi:hypothetical protein